ncbi:MAG: glycosyltransferase family 39 protein [Chloroflexi bacterium]|nr:glycosyltransferase family 39 protein [Chloroflexota bacterium]
MRRWLPCLVILVIAAALRLIALDTTPPGLQHDEVFHGHDAVTVLLGDRPLYFTSNAGNEPLFIYLMSITVGFFGHTELGIRLAAVICGLLALLFTYLWVRRAFNQRTALIAAALLAVNFWPVFLSRVGLRAASVPMMAALVAFLIADFRLLILPGDARAVSLTRRRRMISAILAGAALGLSLYTYPAARTLPVIVAAFFVIYSLITRQLNKPLLLVLIVAAIVFAPLGYTIAMLPEADVRLQQLGGPVQAALSGNFEPVLRFTRDTLGMFTFGGDPIARYNLPGRPVFDPITGMLFYLGLVLALRKWREPCYLFALLWLPIGLLPSMLSDSAPSFLRASASLPVTFLFPALALDWIIFNREVAKARRILGGLVAALIVVSGVSVIRDYFFEWPTRADVREVYRADLARAAKWIEQQPNDQPIVMAGTNPRDLDPFLFDFQVPTKHDVKWVDRAYTIVWPERSGVLVSPAYSPIDPTLRERWLPAPSFVSKFSDGSTAFEVFDLSTAPVISTSIVTVNDGATLNTPIDFNSTLTLLGYEAASNGKACEWAHFWMYWRVKQDVNGQQLPLSIFVHLLDGRGELKVGRDLLGFPSAGWRTGDVWVQQNDLQLPCVIEPGVYQLEIGVYSQADGSRWRVIDSTGTDRGDRLLLNSIEVMK